MGISVTDGHSTQEWEDCEDCYGRGYTSDTDGAGYIHNYTCKKCQGSKMQKVRTHKPFKKKCEECDGWGTLPVQSPDGTEGWSEDCIVCNGEGSVSIYTIQAQEAAKTDKHEYDDVALF